MPWALDRVSAALRLLEAGPHDFTAFSKAKRTRGDAKVGLALLLQVNGVVSTEI